MSDNLPIIKACEPMFGPVYGPAPEGGTLVTLGADAKEGTPWLIGVIPAAGLSTNELLDLRSVYAYRTAKAPGTESTNQGPGPLDLVQINITDTAFELIKQGGRVVCIQMGPRLSSSPMNIPQPEDELAELSLREHLKLMSKAANQPDFTKWLADLAAVAQALVQDIEALPTNLAPMAGAGQKAPPNDTRFFVASCQYPSDILDRSAGPTAQAQPGPADRTLRAIEKRRLEHRASFALLLGDQVYVDATAGLFDPSLADGRFSQAYRHWLGRSSVQRAFSGMWVYTLPDDHELRDNWEPWAAQSKAGASGRTLGPANESNARQSEGIENYWAYQRFDRNGHDNQTIWRTNDTHLATPAASRTRLPDNAPPLFLCDSRTERERRDAGNASTAKIMGDMQWQALTAWLGRHANSEKLCILASGSLVLPRLRQVAQSGDHAGLGALLSDGWEGYPASLHQLMREIWQAKPRRLLLLSGGGHLGLCAEINIFATDAPTGPSVKIYSAHTPAIYAPFNFANAKGSDFLVRDTFEIDPGHPDALTCEISTWTQPAGDGFLDIQATAEGPARIDFLDADGNSVHTLSIP